MIERSLIPHPDFPSPPIAISAEAARTAPGDVILRYVVSGAVEQIRIPEPVRYASRHENLWQHTCFEAFVAAPGKSGYLEFNFAPSTAWDAYRFETYRVRDGVFSCAPPHIDVERSDGRLGVTVVLDMAGTVEVTEDSNWRLGLTAVIEASDGTKSYWALRHAPGAPDFHDPDCFIAMLPAPVAP